MEESRNFNFPTLSPVSVKEKSKSVRSKGRSRILPRVVEEEF